MTEKEILAAKRMRMLRLGVGWSAEKLSQEYRTGGAGELARTTIAKIERDIRPIKAGEVDGVARVFGLTSNDLLDLDGPKVFLSYAEQDAGTAQEVTDWLDNNGFQSIPASPAAADDPGPGSADAWAIDAAQAFVVLLTPHFLSSPRCQQELDLAVRRERQLLTTSPAARFIYVLQVAAEVDLDDSVLSSHLLIDLPTSSDRSREVALGKLGGSILSGARAPDARADPPVPLPASPGILARGEELGRVLNALRNSSGASFWLVISPPGFGKSWLLEQLEIKAAEPESGGWIVTTVDLRSAEPANGQPDAMTVISSLFGVDPPQPSDTDDDCVRKAAQNIIRDGQSCLCLLDSAELLSAATVDQLRQYLGKIYYLVRDSGREDARLAFVAASRRDDGWRGITPPPGLSVLPLGGFGFSVLQDALEGLTRDIPLVRSRTELRKDAELVQRVTEGFPELVRTCLQWIQAEQWVDIERLDHPQLSDKMISPYIEGHLLAQDSLLPEAGDQPAKQLAALREGLRVLVPYRFVTLSHVSHYMQNDLDKDPRFRDALKEADWGAEELWRAIGKTALLLPLDDPWREIHPAVRRLLYRHFYRPDERAAAHARAGDFAQHWAGQLRGKEQVVGLVESIWHQAVRLGLTTSPTMMEEELVTYARTLSSGVRESIAYSQSDLRNYAVRRMKNDGELQREIANVDGLFGRLVEVVADPGAKDA